MNLFLIDDLTNDELYEEIATRMEIEPLKINSLYDELKYKHICNVFHKYSIEQIEKALPE